MRHQEEDVTEFARVIQPKALDTLRRLAEKPGDNWWKDLLKLWRPSGSTADDHGLRLAVRKNYLNFYLQGQSLARVGFVNDEPYVSTHVKYAFGPNEGQLYAKMHNGTDIRHPITGIVLRYRGSATLHEWIKRAGTYKGDEKACVDKLVADNSSIIDLEMGLPEVARRMDCVALECEGDAIRIVFWEAKMIDDDRLRSRSKAEVIVQLKRYKDFLEDDIRAQSVETGYQNACRLFTDIHGMAAQFPNQPALDPLVIAAAEEPLVLKVDPIPRLVIFGGNQKKGNWDFHRNSLKVEKIPCLVFRNPPFRLRRPEAGD
jgi:hypothetical protein